MHCLPSTLLGTVCRDRTDLRGVVHNEAEPRLHLGDGAQLTEMWARRAVPLRFDTALR
jgi:hypothetical protein